MNNIVKNVNIDNDSNVKQWFDSLLNHPMVSEEELIAIRLEYLDVTPEDWKVHIAKVS